MSKFGARARSKLMHTAPRQTGEPTLPLINVVFLLLIFVLLTSVIEADPPVPVDLPFSRMSPELADEGQVVFLSADGRQAVAMSVLDDQALEQWVAEAEPELVAVRADRLVEVGAVFALADRLQELGVGRVELVILTP